MAYNVNYSDETKSPISIENNTIDNTTSLKLIGKDYSRGYGEIIAENFLHVLENFASSNAPDNPVVGQIWFDTTQNLLKVYTVTSTWKSLGTINASTTNPPNTNETNVGDFWVNSTSREVYVNFGENWNLIYREEEKESQIVSKVRRDISNNDHITFELEVKTSNVPDSLSKTVAIFSSDETPWVPLSNTANPELLSDDSIMSEIYPVIYPGLNLYNRNLSEVNVSDQDPNTENPYVKSGDIWVNTETQQYWVYSNSSWLKLSNTTADTKMVARQRLDTGNTSHVTFETIVDGKIIFIDSADDSSYVLNNSEQDEDGNPLVNTFYEPIVIGRNAIPQPGQLISYVPTGAVQSFAMQTVPEGWLPCDGREISRTEYDRLFTLIGTVYGVGDGTTTFNIPDLRGEFVRGWDNGRGIDTGRNFGSNQDDSFESHRHGYVADDNAATITINTDDDNAGTSQGLDNNTSGGGTTTYTTYEGGTETRPRNIALLYCIKI